MSNELKQSHPLLMVPVVYTMGVVLYHNGQDLNGMSLSTIIQDALKKALPAGVGVGSVSVTNHGVYMEKTK